MQLQQRAAGGGGAAAARGGRRAGKGPGDDITTQILDLCQLPQSLATDQGLTKTKTSGGGSREAIDAAVSRVEHLSNDPQWLGEVRRLANGDTGHLGSWQRRKLERGWMYLRKEPPGPKFRLGLWETGWRRVSEVLRQLNSPPVFDWCHFV